MKLPAHLLAMIVLVLLVPRSGAAEMKDELKVEPVNFSVLRGRFGTYGYLPRRTIFWEAAGLRFRLPADVSDVPQTGLYSYFALAGDCQAVLTYELLKVPPPRTGYGSGVGLAFDIEGGAGRGAIQRVLRMGDENGCVLQTAPGESKGKIKDVDRFIPAASPRGRLGLRRVKNELIFLHAEAPTEPLKEIDRLPFTDRTIRAVRVFADPGGSPTAVDVRVSQIDIRAAEIASGLPRSEPRQWSWAWLWLLAPAAGGVLAFRTWRAHIKHRKWSGGVSRRLAG